MGRRNRMGKVLPRPLPPVLIGDPEVFYEKTIGRSKALAYVYVT